MAPPLPPGIQAKCDAQLGVLWPQLQADETQFLATNGIHWQGLSTHQAGIPANGEDVLPDVGALTPHDQPVPWPPNYRENPIAMALTVDVYAGPGGQGYCLTATVQTTPPQVPEEAASRYSRALAVGPEPGWAHDWRPVVVAEMPV